MVSMLLFESSCCLVDRLILENVAVIFLNRLTLLLCLIPQVSGGVVAEGHGILHTHVLPCFKKPAEQKLNHTASFQFGLKL